jgi:hypothetical protein
MQTVERKEAAWLRRTYRTWFGSDEEGFPAFRDFVEEIQVELHPGSRAVLHHPQQEPMSAAEQAKLHPGSRIVRHYPSPAETVWIRFRFDPRQEDSYFVREITFRGDPYLPWRRIDVSPYIAALGLKLGSKVEAGTGGRRPKSGREPSVAFYRKLLADYDALLKKGAKAPVKALAQRRGVPVGTVKSWLSRGRRYLNGGG